MSTRAWFEKALADGRAAFKAGKGRDNIPMSRRSMEGRFYWQAGWDEAKKAAENTCDYCGKPVEDRYRFTCPECARPGCPECMLAGRGVRCPECEEE